MEQQRLFTSITPCLRCAPPLRLPPRLAASQVVISFLMPRACWWRVKLQSQAPCDEAGAGQQTTAAPASTLCHTTASLCRQVEESGGRLTSACTQKQRGHAPT